MSNLMAAFWPFKLLLCQYSDQILNLKCSFRFNKMKNRFSSEGDNLLANSGVFKAAFKVLCLTGP